MIQLPAELVPSVLLHYGAPPEPLERLLKKAAQLRRMGDLWKAEQWARQAHESSREAVAHVSRAAALIHLSDIYREMGRLGPTLKCARGAYEILRRQPALYQRHNEAVAAYSLGLIHHLLGNDVDAISLYLAAQRGFEEAREYWAMYKEVAWYRTCARLQHWIRGLSNSLTREGSYTGSYSIYILPARLLGGVNDLFSVVEFKVDGYLVGQDLFIGERAFAVHDLADSGREGLRGRLLSRDEECQVLEIPKPACAQIGARQGDHLLVQETEYVELDTPFYVVEGAAGPDFGKFRRSATTGEVSFESMVSGQVIGDVIAAGFPTFYPLALLRPTG